MCPVWPMSSLYDQWWPALIPTVGTVPPPLPTLKNKYPLNVPEKCRGSFSSTGHDSRTGVGSGSQFLDVTGRIKSGRDDLRRSRVGSGRVTLLPDPTRPERFDPARPVKTALRTEIDRSPVSMAYQYLFVRVCTGAAATRFGAGVYLSVQRIFCPQ